MGVLTTSSSIGWTIGPLFCKCLVSSYTILKHQYYDNNYVGIYVHCSFKDYAHGHGIRYNYPFKLTVDASYEAVQKRTFLPMTIMAGLYLPFLIEIIVLYRKLDPKTDSPSGYSRIGNDFDPPQNDINNDTTESDHVP